MGVKYVFVTGGVVSGLGKGITAASLGRLLKARGYHVTMQKLDPYINVDPGTMNPIQHGEVFVTDDGTETDLDLGHYERFIDEKLDRNSNVTTGKIYQAVLTKERRGDYGGGTVQVIPHITDEIKSRFYRAKEKDEERIAIIEVGGTAGDIESQPFLEAIRQFQHEVGRENAILIHVTLIPYLKASGEMKTKPTQMSVKELQRMGIWPDILVCRSDYPLDDKIREKIGLFCNVEKEHVLQNLDASSLYEVPLMLEKERLAQAVCECLRLPCPQPDLNDWKAMLERLHHPKEEVTVALVGKYVALHDAYLSVAEALRHGGIANRAEVNIRWIDSEELTPENLEEYLHDVDAVLVIRPQRNGRQDPGHRICQKKRDSLSGDLSGHAAGDCGIRQGRRRAYGCGQRRVFTGLSGSGDRPDAGTKRRDLHRGNPAPGRLSVCFEGKQPGQAALWAGEDFGTAQASV